MAFCARCKRLFRAHVKRHVFVLVVRLRRCPNTASAWSESQINGFGGEAAFNVVGRSRSAYGERRLQEVTGDGVVEVAASSFLNASSFALPVLTYWKPQGAPRGGRLSRAIYLICPLPSYIGLKTQHNIPIIHSFDLKMKIRFSP